MTAEDVLGVDVKHEAPDMVYFWSEDSHSSLGKGWCLAWFSLLSLMSTRVSNLLLVTTSTMTFPF